MRFQGLDLNLLVAFDALVDHRNVSQAARSMNLSQSAMSNALARLRQFFNDDLLVSTGRGMTPTPKAEELAPAVREALLGIQARITDPDKFDPASSKREFTISASDYVHTVLLNPLMSELVQSAPGVRFRILPVTSASMDQFARGNIDLAILADVVLLDGHPNRLLFQDTFTAICSHDHSRLNERLTMDQLCSLGHVATSLGADRPGTIVDQLLVERRIERRVEVVVPTFSALAATIVGTNRIALLHQRLAEVFAARLPIRILELPMELPPVREFVQWHKLRDRDIGLLWLIDKLQANAAQLTLGGTHEIHV